MYNLQGILRKNVINANMQFERLGYVTSNVTNYNTNAYKPVRFESMLNEDGYLTGVLRTDFSQGSLRLTQREFDVAIDGTGFIPVTSESGEVTYTRDGSFKTNTEGYLITNDGHMVGDGIKLPYNYYKVTVKEDGTVQCLSSNDAKPETVGKIPLVMFANAEGLKSANNNKYIATQESGEPILVKNHNEFKQGYLEMSKTNIYSSVNDVLRLNASMIASTKLMKVVDDMYYKAVNLDQ